MAKKKNSRSAQGSGTIRQRSDGRWEARYTVGRDPGTGKQIQKSVYGLTQKEVRQKLALYIASIDEGIYSEPSKLTVSEWLDIWLNEFLGDVKPRTQELYRHTVEHRIKPSLGAIRLSDLRAAPIQKFYNSCYRCENPLSPKSIKNIHGIFHRALEQAVEAGYIRSNPSDACKTPRVVKKEIMPLDEVESKSFMETIKGDPYERLYLVALFTGLREGEILGLKWEDIDFDEGCIRVSRQLQLHKGEYVLVQTKNSKPRVITPANFVLSILKEQKREQASSHILAGSEWHNSGFVFTGSLGDHLRRQTVYKHFKDAVRRIGIPERRFHDLRHTYAVASLRAGDDPKTVSENLGHATVAFTLDIYGHVTSQMKKASADRMDAYIRRITGNAL